MHRRSKSSHARGERLRHGMGRSRDPYHPAVTDLEAAWNEIHDAKPDGWFVGTPVYIERRGWEEYAFDTQGAPQARAPDPGMDSGRAVGARRRARDGAVPAANQRGRVAEIEKPRPDGAS